ncbi:SDR family NAD(P)-dependent oxidoreductase [Polyangium sp. 15x6]|uniref:SDR family NAD(P)-dependent oxidoreductase n=1 Tax=Polyangium sp. 15x6 TaxID=3042687 RepID=UPI002499BB60|nr:SDR family NAD(P)-dependent oxidoreductase [Polyangium sp. 15x6]MDI3288774.1 SDR family NAD(P)-dependent oxidoreductase [Polyangium sp. 15x6]
MDLELDGRRALVTGATAGLGEAIATFLAAEGVHVVVHGRDEGRADKVAEAIRAAGGRAEVALGDLASDAGADSVATKALAGGPIDILVNNAGVYHHRNWTEATPAIWLDTYQTNVLSSVRMIQRLVPQMRARGWGRVIQIGGGLAQQPIAMQPDYNASLAARHNLAVSLARELQGSGVTSNVVAPGAILVPSVQQLLTEVAPRFGWGDSEDAIERGAVRDLVPNDVGRLGRPKEIAAAVAYLASPHADYVSGAVLRVDGGTIRAAF